MSGAPPELPGVEHRWVDASGLRTHVALAGPPDAPPLLLVHGWPQHWWAWRHVIPALADSRRLICPDLRGHGWSDAPGYGYEKRRFAGDLLALLDVLELERVEWVGHDWGALLGLLAALQAPERCERLLMLAMPPPWSGVSMRRLTLLAYQLPLAAPLLGTALVRRGVARTILRAGRARGSWDEHELDVYDDVLRSRPEATVELYRTFLARELPAILAGRYAEGTLQVPTRLLAGGSDPVTAGLAPGRNRHQPALQVEVVEGLGHWIPEEAPELVVARVLAPG